MADVAEPMQRFTRVMLQRAAWHRTPKVCPRCGSELDKDNHIVDRRTEGIWCESCYA